MAETIDWRAPLDFNIVFEDVGEPMKLLFVEVETTDGKSINSGGWHKRNDGLWELRIRNRKPAPQYPPELVERAFTLLREMGPCFGKGPSAMLGSHYFEAQAILADLPQPVDADLELARACLDAADNAEGAVLMAIKRVRAEKG